MADRIVVGYFGDRASLAATVRASAARGLEVVAVAFDLGGKTSLSGLRDDALSLGAVRCHALDVRDEFARLVIVPGLAADDGADPRQAVDALARRFLSASLGSIGRLEAAAVVEPNGFDVPWRTAANRRETLGPAAIALRFLHEMPSELNGIPMTPVEILESLETITGLAALDVLATAYRELPASPGGLVELEAADGRVDVISRLVTS